MPDQANVKSFDAIEQVRAALLAFGKQAEEGLTEIDLEMRRMVDWMEHNRPGFWTEQVRLAWDGVGQAKADLHRCLMFPVGVNDRPSCSEERAALKKAQAKLAYCEEKKEKLQHWIREIHHEVHTYEGRTARLREVIESDVPTASTALARILTQLEEYTNMSSSARRAPVASTSDEVDESNSDEASDDEGTDEGTKEADSSE